MKKINVSDASEQTLNWLVAICEGFTPADMKRGVGYFVAKDPGKAKYFCHGAGEGAHSGFARAGFKPSSNWTQGGVIIDREDIDIDSNSARTPRIKSRAVMTSRIKDSMGFYPRVDAFGPTKLIAAMRCYVIAVKGNEVEIPEEML